MNGLTVLKSSNGLLRMVKAIYLKTEYQIKLIDVDRTIIFASPVYVYVLYVSLQKTFRLLIHIKSLIPIHFCHRSGFYLFLHAEHSIKVITGAAQFVRMLWKYI